MKRTTIRYRFLCLLTAAALALSLCPAALAESFTANIMRLLNYEGDVYVLDEEGNYRFLLEGSRFNSGESLNTGAGSMAAVELDATKVLTLDSLTQVTFVKERNQMRMNLATGRLLLDVQEKLDENEEFDITTSTMTVGIRGTIVYLTSYDTAQAEISETLSESNGTFRELLVKVLPKGYSGNYSQLVVLEGTAIARYVDHQGQTRAVEVHAGEKITVVDANLDSRADAGDGIEVTAAASSDLGDDLVAYISNNEELNERVENASDLLTGACPHQFEVKSRREPTCTEDGEETSVCALCGEVQNVVLPATGHAWGGWKFYRGATEEQEGQEIRICENDETHIDRRPIPRLQHVHTKGAAVRENETEPTCTGTGSYDSVVYCTSCGAEISRTTQTIPAAGHTPNTDPGYPPTCTEPGWTDHIYCAVCEDILPPYQEEIPATGHSYGEWTVLEEPGCTDTGLRKHSCQTCGYEETETMPALGHNYGEWVTEIEPTCQEEGLRVRVCLRCNDSYEDERIPKTDHIPAVAVGNGPTCTEPGCTDEVGCGVCGVLLQASELIPALGHSFGEWSVVQEPDCVEEGLQQHTCTRCGAVETGTIPALGHEYGDPVTLIDATCTEPGKQQRTCLRPDCGSREYITIPATGHQHVEIRLGTQATCTTPGRHEAEVCTDCGTVLSGGGEIPALGGSHNYTYVGEGEQEIYADDGVTPIGMQYYHDEVCDRCGEFRRVIDETAYYPVST